MSEDVSATMRVGITVILVAALVAVVLNLMVMSNSLLNNGQTTLQSGIDSVSAQEFAVYDNTKVSGTQVATAMSLFSGRDVAIVIQTKAFRENNSHAGTNQAGTALNYGALLTGDGNSSTPSNFPIAFKVNDTGGNLKFATTGNTSGAIKGGPMNFNDSSYKDPTSGGSTNTIASIRIPGDSSATPINVTTFLTTQAKTAWVVTYSASEVAGGKCAMYRTAGASFWTGQLHNTNGLVDGNYDVIGTTELGNDAYLLSSSRFSSVLIKDQTGSIIGIFFQQLN